MSELQPHCNNCGEANATIKCQDQYFCRGCATFMMDKLKMRYYAGQHELGWTIQELWEQVRNPYDLWIGDAESFIEADEISRDQHEDMALYYRSPDARKLLRIFVQEKLDGEVQNFQDFDFETLKGDELFGSVNSQPFDGDNTYIIRAVYVLLWGKVYPGLDDWRSIGTGKRYRGDTIHTFHTIFGRANPEKPGHFYGIDRFAPIDEVLYERVRKFQKKVCNLGNYVVLPNACVKTSKCFVTLNTYRGTNQWRDYFDQFLLALDSCLSYNNSSDKVLDQLVHKVNSAAWGNYGSPEGFTQWAKALQLDDFLDAAGRAKNLFADTAGQVHFHWENPHRREKFMCKASSTIWIMRKKSLLTAPSRWWPCFRSSAEKSSTIQINPPERTRDFRPCRILPDVLIKQPIDIRRFNFLGDLLHHGVRRRGH